MVKIIRPDVVKSTSFSICDAIILGITGGAIDSKEAELGPILLQGDHGPIEFQNIVITTAKKEICKSSDLIK